MQSSIRRTLGYKRVAKDKVVRYDASIIKENGWRSKANLSTDVFEVQCCSNEWNNQAKSKQRQKCHNCQEDVPTTIALHWSIIEPYLYDNNQIINIIAEESIIMVHQFAHRYLWITRWTTKCWTEKKRYRSLNSHDVHNLNDCPHSMPVFSMGTSAYICTRIILNNRINNCWPHSCCYRYYN